MKQFQHAVQDDFSNRWWPVLVAYFLRRVDNRAEAEDLTQDVFKRLLTSDTSDVQSAEAYVFRVASNLLADRARRSKVRNEYLHNAATTEERHVEWLDPSRIASNHEAIDKLAASVSALPKRTRDIFVLYRFEGMSQDDIADSIGISRSAVKKHVAKALRYLVIQLRDSR
ncbi:hypothetical protein BA177_01750 [Woeseia oceani]|uniref:RNA polymerase subunit sigma-24 n=2 Tax=Woeseia oceani TaxID=1548547 RepID=A0A193LC49_9GAMM|nr:hypothetical protein BA177_01750 [Woeseia oceani]